MIELQKQIAVCKSVIEQTRNIINNQLIQQQALGGAQFYAVNQTTIPLNTLVVELEKLLDLIKTIDVSFYEKLKRIRRNLVNSNARLNAYAFGGLLQIIEILDEKYTVKDNSSVPLDNGVTIKKSNNKVFVVHGHDDLTLVETENLMRKLGLVPIILKDQANGGLNTIIEKFEQNSDVGFAIVLFTSDDIGYKKDDAVSAKTRARQNVVFELGYFAAKLGRKNVAIINDGVEELPSDIQGVTYTPNSADWKYKVAIELRQAGLDVDMNKV